MHGGTAPRQLSVSGFLHSYIMSHAYLQNGKICTLQSHVLPNQALKAKAEGVQMYAMHAAIIHDRRHSASACSLQPSIACSGSHSLAVCAALVCGTCAEAVRNSCRATWQHMNTSLYCVAGALARAKANLLWQLLLCQVVIESEVYIL